MRLTWSVLVCSACPYLWDPPEYAEPITSPADSDTDADTDADTDVDTDTDTDADTDETGTPPAPEPTITAFTATLVFDRVVLGFTVVDPNDDVTELRVEVDGEAYVYTTDGLETWNGTTGTVSFPEPVTCDGFAHTYSLSASDAEGHRSPEVATALAVNAVEIGEGGEPIDLGTVGLPAVLCADHQNQGDTDDWDFEVDPPGPWSVAITHAGDDRDVAILDPTGVVLARSEDLAVPDAFVFTFVAGTLYRLHTEQAETGPGDRYLVVISQ